MELKEGMVVELRNGNRYLLRRTDGQLFGSALDGWLNLTYYDENLCEVSYDTEDFDIMKIYTSNSHTLDNLFKDEYLDCIWERKEPKKMTLAQIGEALGYEVEVIDNE